MVWIKCSEKLPYQEPEHWLTFNWVLVTSLRDPNVITLARYTPDGWEFLYSENIDDESCIGACCGDIIGEIGIDDITHWMLLPNPPKSTYHF
jgi:hypothetical protein